MILRVLLFLAISFLLAKIANTPKRKRVVRQYGVPYANNLYDLSRRARRKV